MGRIADLLEKRALNQLTDVEAKELDSLLAEAKLVEDEHKTDDDESVEEAAQKMADVFQKSIGGFESKMDKVLEALSEKKDETHDVTPNFIIDKSLGKNHTVDELSEIKVALPGRKQAGKENTEVSQKSIEFLSALYSDDKQKLQILSEGTSADGGFLVPAEFANVIVEDIRDASIMRSLASVMTTQSNSVHIPSLISRPKAAWRAEKATKNTSTATFAENILTPYSLAAIVPLSNELVADAKQGVGGSIVNYIAGLMATALNEAEEQAFWTGSGSGRPSGVDGGAYSLRAVSAGLTDTTRADALIQAYQTMPQGYRNKAVWVANMGTLFEIGRLKDTQNRYLLTDLAGSPTQLIKGRPVYESNFLAGGTVLFGDFSFYQIVDREGISVRVSDEATVAGSSAFEKNLTYVRVEKRVDAELLLPAAVTKVTGVGTP
jgi:HK97 family phage major capsid protein